MSKTLILYRSKYGSTKKYVQWLSEALHCDACEVRRYDYQNTGDYSAVILAGGVYAGGISVLKAMVDSNFKALAGKKAAVLAVGASPYDETHVEELRKTLPKILDAPVFYARGAYDESRMKLGDRLLCSLLRKTLRKKDPSDYEPWMEGLIESDGKPCDWTRRQNLQDLIDYMREEK